MTWRAMCARQYEAESPEGEMTFKGVVFNEMKGVYSSPESVLQRECQQALFPDNTYGVDSGGHGRTHRLFQMALQAARS